MIDGFGETDIEGIKYLDIPEDTMLMVAYDFLFQAKFENGVLRLHRVDKG